MKGYTVKLSSLCRDNPEFNDLSSTDIANFNLTLDTNKIYQENNKNYLECNNLTKKIDENKKKIKKMEQENFQNQQKFKEFDEKQQQ